MATRSVTTNAERSQTAVQEPPPQPTQALARRPAPLTPDDGPKELTYDIDDPRNPRPRIGQATDEPDAEQWARDNTYTGLSERPVTDEQAKALLEPVRDDELMIKPDSFGAVYLSHPGYRRRLNAAFKPGGWGLRRISPFNFEEKTGMLYAEYALYAEGRFLAAATGEQKYQGEGRGNDEMTKGDAIEGCRSNALMRCCKDLGMAMECWDKDFTDRWRAKYCFRVWVEGRQRPSWRRMIDPPFYKESGIADDSPNKDQYQGPKTQQARAANRGGASQGVRTPEEARQEPATNGAPRGNPDRQINEKQVKFFWREVDRLNLDQDDVAEYLKATFNVTSSKELTNSQLDQALQWVRS